MKLQNLAFLTIGGITLILFTWFWFHQHSRSDLRDLIKQIEQLEQRIDTLEQNSRFRLLPNDITIEQGMKADELEHIKRGMDHY